MSWQLVLLLALTVCGGSGFALGFGTVWLYDRLTCSDTYEPAASETPEETAWRDVQEVLANDVPSELEVELYDAIRRHRDGEDVTAGAPKEQT